MARPASQYAQQPGFVCARACLAPCGGEIVLYDCGTDSGCDRWVVKHQPSGNAIKTGSRGTARSLYGALAKGIDKRGVLPKVEAPEPEPVATPEPPASPPPPETPVTPPETPKTLTTPPLSPEAVARARARGTESTEPVKQLLKTMEATSVDLALALETSFPESKIIGYLEDMLEAERSFQQDGNVITVPDFTAREKGLKLIMEMKYGKAYARAEPKANQKMDFAQFEIRMRQSPAFRSTLRLMLEEAEADAKAQAAEIVPTKPAS